MNSTASSVVAATSSFVAETDPTALLHTQLSSALSTLGDAQFWEETISPATVRNELSAADPSNPNSTPTLQRGMKWLLASISKGRDVSDFYPHVVKLVGATSLEVRKMVFMYLVQYADHDATTRELSLLSINSFQRGLADHEQLIRGLALRVLSSIRIQDILQIQILGVQKSAKDSSPYVRKCAANALAKLSPRCDAMQREMLLEIMKTLLDAETSTMVLTSTLIAFTELCPERLDLIHSSFRKICHLLTDMDEWGQVVGIDMLARYCRAFFKEPQAWKGGTAEKIDRERRVFRDAPGANQATLTSIGDGFEALDLTGGQLPAKKLAKAPKKMRRRVVKKGFYSDEEDSSTEEEVYAESPAGTTMSTAGAMRQRNILGLPGVEQPIAVDMEAKEDMDLDEDHRLLLDSSMLLLKSRNAGVVLSVCSLHYYCGVSSIKARSAIGKALVRIHRDRREIQYVVLTSIQTLVHECPSAFAPFLPDFFVKVRHQTNVELLVSMVAPDLLRLSIRRLSIPPLPASSRLIS
jgi:AP-3 complex subunit beta